MKEYGPTTPRAISHFALISPHGFEFQFRSRPPIPLRMNGIPRMVRLASTMPTGTFSTQYSRGAKSGLPCLLGYSSPLGYSGGDTEVNLYVPLTASESIVTRVCL